MIKSIVISTRQKFYKYENSKIKEIEPIIIENDKGKVTRRMSIFECVCKNTFVVNIYSVKCGNTKSCGCLQKEAILNNWGMKKSFNYENR